MSWGAEVSVGPRSFTLSSRDCTLYLTVHAGSSVPAKYVYCVLFVTVFIRG